MEWPIIGILVIVVFIVIILPMICGDDGDDNTRLVG